MKWNNSFITQSEISIGKEVLSGWRATVQSIPEIAEESHRSPFSEPVCASWKTQQSRDAATFLWRRGVKLPWGFGEKLGQEFSIRGLRAGGSGVVFLVERHTKIYAAKTLQAFFSESYFDIPARKRLAVADAFMQEALPWLTLGQHPNIVPVRKIESVTHPKHTVSIPFVFSEYVDGGSLRDILKDQNFYEGEVIDLGIQLCEGLAHTYSYGVVAHKDLKPDNVMVSKTGTYRITDFSTGVIGTPGYMAPEQVAKRWRVSGIDITSIDFVIDSRVDQFAIGIILLEALQGSHPFPFLRDVLPARNAAETGDDTRIRASDYVRNGAGQIPGGICSEPLMAIIARLLSPRPEDRYPDLRKVKEELLCLSDRGYQVPEFNPDDSMEWWRDRSESFLHLGRFDAAIAPLEKTLTMARDGKDTFRAQCHEALGIAYWNSRRFAEAKRHIEEALQIFERLKQEEDAAIEKIVKGRKEERGRDEAAQTKPENDALDRAVATILIRVFGTHSWDVDIHRGFASCLMMMGCVCLDLQEHTDAVKHLERALKKSEEITYSDRDKADCLGNLGNAYWATHQPRQAEEAINRALEIFKGIPGTEIQQGKCFHDLGNVFLDVGDFDRAEQYYKKALDMYMPIPGTEIERARSELGLGALYIRSGASDKAKEAKNLLRDAVKLCDQNPQDMWDLKHHCELLLGSIRIY